MDTNEETQELTRTAWSQYSALDFWLEANLPARTRCVYLALQDLLNWIDAVQRPNECPSVDPARALAELQEAVKKAAKIMQHRKIEAIGGAA